MSNKLICKECKKNFNEVTRESLCAFCYKRKYGEWSKDFSEDRDKRT